VNLNLVSFYFSSLRHLSISNVIPKLNQVPMNMGEFQASLSAFVGNGKLKHLQLIGLNELDDEFFVCLFLSFPLVALPNENDFKSLDGSNPNGFASHSIETIEMRDLNKITGKMIFNFLINRSNNLRELKLHGCKKIGCAEVKKFQKIIMLKNLECKISWI